MENIVHAIFYKDLKYFTAINLNALDIKNEYLSLNEYGTEYYLLYLILTNQKDVFEIVLSEYRENVTVDNYYFLDYFNASLYFLNGDTKTALKHYKKCIDYLENHRIKLNFSGSKYGLEFKAMTYNNIGLCYKRENKLYSAKEYIEKAFSIYQFKTQNENRRLGCILALSSIELSLTNYAKARQYIKIIERSNHERLITKSLVNLIYIYFMEENFKEGYKRVKHASKILNHLSTQDKFMYFVSSSLICHYLDKSKESNQYIVAAKKLIIEYSINSNQNNKILEMVEIEVNQHFNKQSLEELQQVIIPFFTEEGLINFVVQSMKLSERINCSYEKNN
jgi:tetratricopeptide (TPR) repeat protein